MNGLLALQACWATDLRIRRIVYALRDAFGRLEALGKSRAIWAIVQRTGARRASAIRLSSSNARSSRAWREARSVRYRACTRALREHLSGDVRWVCQQLQSLTGTQWHDAFRAAVSTHLPIVSYAA
jgi:hypothetical protein